MLHSKKGETCAVTPCASYPGSDAVCKLLFAMDNYKIGDEITHRLWVMADHSHSLLLLSHLKNLLMSQPIRFGASFVLTV
jgi:hypothetical protein